MLQAKTEEQKNGIKKAFINSSPDICTLDIHFPDNDGIIVYGYVTFDQMSEIVDYLRSANRPKKSQLDMSIVAPNMLEPVETWLAYKKEKGKMYKPIGFKNFYKKLCELSGNNPQIAMTIIEQSMANNYDGIFPIRCNNNTYYNYPRSVDDVKDDDVQPTLEYFNYWIEKAAPRVCDGIIGGRPETQDQYQRLIDHTVGGARGLCYVVLVFQRDGWDEYYDKRGFMFTYSNYIRKNGLFRD